MTTRRALLLGGATALLAGCSQGSSWPGGDDNPPGAGGCRTPGQLVGFSRVAGAQLVYEQTRRPTSMKIDPAFLQQVNTWAEDWAALSGLGAIQAVVSFGAYVDKCQSYHQLGRAFDITELQHEAGTISMRYDQWQPGTAQQLRNYWRVAASLHLHFAYTLAYPFDSAHDDHVHVDNLVSKDGLSKFNSRPSLATGAARI